MTTLGERIKRIRLALGMSQAELADRVNVDQSTPSRWEKDKTNPTDESLLAIAELSQEIEDLDERYDSVKVLRYGRESNATTSGLVVAVNLRSPEESFAGRLRRSRSDAGYSQKTLADAIGRSTGAVAAWELGQYTPSVEMMGRLAEILSVSRPWLISGDVLAPADPDEDGLSVQIYRMNRRLDRIEKMLEAISRRMEG